MLGVGGGVVETPRCSPSASRAPELQKWDEGFGRSTGNLSGRVAKRLELPRIACRGPCA